MARIKLEIPANKIGTFQIPVRITDINYGNHVGNDSFIAIIHDARMQLLQQNGFTELNVDGTGLIMGDIAVEFKSEAFYGDTVAVEIFADNISKISFELYYKLATIRKGENILLANAKTGMVCYDYAAKKVAPIPEVLKKILNG